MIKKLPLVVLLFLLATLPFQSIASEKENFKNTGSTTTTIECPTIANKTTTICSGNTFSITPTNTLPDVVPAGTTYTWTTPVISPTGALTGGSEQTTGQTNISQTLSNTTTASATATYTVTANTGTCTATFTTTVMVEPNNINTITRTSAAGTDWQTICVNNYDNLKNITYATTGATGATISGLPAGVTGSWTGNTVTISGKPAVYGDFNYTITLTGGCGNITKTGSIFGMPNNTIMLSSAAGTDAQTVCVNSPITNITYATTGATGASITGLPSGVTGRWAGNEVTISGTPTVSGTYVYTIVLNGGCGNITKTGTITVNPLPEATLTGGTTICKNATAPILTFTGSNGIAPYTFTYTLNNGPIQTITTTSGNTAQIQVPTSITGVYVYNLTSVKASSTLACSKTITGQQQTVIVNGAPAMVTIVTNTTTICPGSSVTFVANTTNAGTNPTYQWLLNTSTVVGTGSIFTYNTLRNNDVLNVIMTSSSACATNNPVTSPGVQIKVTPSVTPLVSITVDKNNICAGTLVNFTANPTNGGANPTYIWKKNTVAVQSGTSASFSTTSLGNNDVVTVEMMSNQTCVINNPAVSNGIIIIKKSNTPVSIVDTSTANNTYAVSGVCDACSDDATYKWSIGNQTVSNTKEYNYNNLNNGDIVTLTVTDVTNCLLGETTMIVTIKRNTLSGKVVYNVANDNCATGIALQGKAVVAKQNNATYIGYTNKTGDYEINVPEGTYTLSVNKEVNDPTTISPQNVTVVVQGANNNYNNNFCLYNTSNEHDVAVTMYPLNDARPGYEAKYILRLQNKDYSFVSGTFTLKYDPTKMNFTSATPTIASNTNGILTWDYTNLAPGTALEINLVMTIVTPPTVNSGTVLNYVLTGNLTLTDKNPQDNVYNYNQTVVNSYDPNDKIVVEGAYINEGQAADYLHYITRFQNTGTASAINVVIKETLDSNLDWSTFEPEGTSHPGNIELKLGNELLASFPNIDLADSTTNEPASHGWIAYKIKPKAGFAIGDIAFAKSDIYFDFNAPIITNTVSTQIQLLSAADFESNTIQLYPNPVTESFSITTDQEIENITIFDLNGRKVSETKNTNSVNIAELTSGLYLVEVRTSNGIFRKKLLKN